MAEHPPAEILLRIGTDPETRTTLEAFLADNGGGLLPEDVAYIRQMLDKGNRVMLGGGACLVAELRAAPRPRVAP